MYIDFHTHILPEIDDGATDVYMSLEMLSLAERSNAEKVVLTPHVKASSDFDKFLELRNKKYDLLTSLINEKNMSCPHLLLGAEVLLDISLSERENVRSLCVEGTDILLLELPYTLHNSWLVHEIYDIVAKHEVTPLIAHVERYLKSPKDVKGLDVLISCGVKFQVNASSFLSLSGRRIIRELVAEGLISAIGSDAHNLSDRSSDMTLPLKAFSKRFGPGFLEYMYDKSSSLLNKNKTI